MKNSKPKFNIICYFPKEKEDIKNLSDKVSEIHTEAVIRYMERSEIKNNDKQRIIDKIIESE